MPNKKRSIGVASRILGLAFVLISLSGFVGAYDQNTINQHIILGLHLSHPYYISALSDFKTYLSMLGDALVFIIGLLFLAGVFDLSFGYRLFG
jgi:hypothetical protein